MAALDLMIKSLISSREFNERTDKNWEAICRLVPGATVKQCKKRYDELLQENVLSSSYIPSRMDIHSGSSTRVRSEDNHYDSRSSRPNSAKNKGGKFEKDSVKSESKRPGSTDTSPMMVIHVCDESKALKQDFNCPRDLLVNEMKYFAEYLSTDAQRWEEVDISVHCDVKIFDWLMKYTKRNAAENKEKPAFEPKNVISILISSEFLKMDNLVQECIEYCHDNMNEILETPCNMNCINDEMLSRITDTFTHNEADDVIDKREKFKSRLFAKKLEKLFKPDESSPDSPQNASTLYRCKICKSVITKTLESQVKCLQSRMMVNKRGKLMYNHERDPQWDVNEFLLDLKTSLKNWRDVYWRVWGHINFLACSRCHNVFPCTELGHCKYHAEPAQYDTGSTPSSTKPVGLYPCCHQNAYRFDPTQENQSCDACMWGCKVRDHIVNLDSPEINHDPAITKVYDDLLSHRDMICRPYYKANNDQDQDSELKVFEADELACVVNSSILTKGRSRINSSVNEPIKPEAHPPPRLQALTIEKEEYDEDYGMGESEDELGDDEEVKPRKKIGFKRSRVTVDANAILLDAPDFSTINQRKWDSSRSLRWNQDAQREEDQRRMNDIVNYLTKLRLNPDKVEKQKQKEFAGGLFSKIEAQWRTINMPPPKAPSLQIRNKPRLTQVQIKGGSMS